MSTNLAEIEQEFQTGLRLIQEGNIDKAESKLLSILQLLPDNPVLHERVGYCYALQSDWDNAAQHYSKASQLLPENSEILNNYGCVLQKLDRWEEALPHFKKAYKADPNNLSALTNLAQTLNFCRRPDEAMGYYVQALEKQPENLSLRFQLADILHTQERYQEEIVQYRLILAREEKNVKAQIKLALSLFATGSWEEASFIINNMDEKTEAIAITLFDWAKQAQEKENFTDATYGLGLLTKLVPESLEFWQTYVINHYFAFGLEDSLGVFEQAIKQFPKEPSFYKTLAIGYGQAGDFTKSVEAAKKVIELTPQNAKAHQTYAAILRQYQKSRLPVADIDEVCVHFDKAITLATTNNKELQEIAQSIVETKETEIMKHCISKLPYELQDSFLFHLLQNYICASDSNFPDAIKHGEKCRDMEPENSFALSELAETYFYMEDYEAALHTGREAVRVNPKDSQALMRLGHLAVDCGKIEEGLDFSEQAYSINPHDPSIMLSLGLINLLVGNWDRGWEMYDARFKMQHKHRIDIPPIPRWDGRSFSELELVIICEQGLGDIIQFARFLPLAAKRAKKTTFIANPSLMHLFNQYSNIAEILPANAKFKVDQQNGRWASLLDLPRLLEIPEKNWGDTVPYIQTQQETVDRWKNKICDSNDKLNVGIAWQGSPWARIDVGRSIPLKCFEPLTHVPDIRLISLQKYHGEEQIEKVSFKEKIERLGDESDTGPNAFADTVAVMALLDLIITSDTSIAHLAGALGRPVWLALKYVPDWRWRLNSAKSCWYPTMRLFRQTVPGIWTDVMENIAEELKHYKSSDIMLKNSQKGNDL